MAPRETQASERLRSKVGTHQSGMICPWVSKSRGLAVPVKNVPGYFLQWQFITASWTLSFRHIELLGPNPQLLLKKSINGRLRSHFRTRHLHSFFSHPDEPAAIFFSKIVFRLKGQCYEISDFGWFVDKSVPYLSWYCMFRNFALPVSKTIVKYPMLLTPATSRLLMSVSPVTNTEPSITTG